MAAKTTPTDPSVKTAATAAPVAEVKEVEFAQTPAQTAADAAGAIADPAPATSLDNPSGAIIEPAIAQGVNLAHEAIDANPRARTTALQNAIDLNDAKRANPVDPDFAGEGIDLTVYGDRIGKAAADAADEPAKNG